MDERAKNEVTIYGVTPDWAGLRGHGGAELDELWFLSMQSELFS